MTSNYSIAIMDRTRVDAENRAFEAVENHRDKKHMKRVMSTDSTVDHLPETVADRLRMKLLIKKMQSATPARAKTK